MAAGPVAALWWLLSLVWWAPVLVIVVVLALVGAWSFICLVGALLDR